MRLWDGDGTLTAGRHRAKTSTMVGRAAVSSPGICLAIVIIPFCHYSIIHFWKGLHIMPLAGRMSFRLVALAVYVPTYSQSVQSQSMIVALRHGASGSLTAFLYEPH